MTFHGDPYGRPPEQAPAGYQHPVQPPAGWSYPAPPGSGYDPGRPPTPYEMARPTNSLAPVALALGIGGFLFPLVCIGAIVCGHLARRDIRETGEDGAGMALAGLILGWVSLALHVLFLFLMILITVVGMNASTTSP